MLINFIRYLFFIILIRPLILVVLGLNIRNRIKLPTTGPAILVANHNSHLDTLVLMTLFPLSRLSSIRPVAAMDYFCSNPLLKWFSLNIMHIIPLERKFSTYHKDPLANISLALEEKQIVIIYPEGTRGEPEKMSNFKKGIAHLTERHQDVPVVPIFMHGLGKSLPSGEGILVPFFCDVFIGDQLFWTGDRNTFMELLNQQMQSLSEKGNFPLWH